MITAGSVRGIVLGPAGRAAARPSPPGRRRSACRTARSGVHGVPVGERERGGEQPGAGVVEQRRRRRAGPPTAGPGRQLVDNERRRCRRPGWAGPERRDQPGRPGPGTTASRPHELLGHLAGRSRATATPAEPGSPPSRAVVDEHAVPGEHQDSRARIGQQLVEQARFAATFGAAVDRRPGQGQSVEGRHPATLTGGGKPPGGRFPGALPLPPPPVPALPWRRGPTNSSRARRARQRRGPRARAPDGPRAARW